MNNGILGTNLVVSVGIVVKDIEKTKKKYADFLGVPEPEAFWTGDIKDTHQEYFGKPCPAKARLAFFQVGEELQIELIEPDEKPSLWRDTLNSKGEGVLEVAFRIKGMKEKLASLDKIGMPAIQKGEYKGGRYANIDSMKELKVLICLLEND